MFIRYTKICIRLDQGKGKGDMGKDECMKEENTAYRVANELLAYLFLLLLLLLEHLIQWHRREARFLVPTFSLSLSSNPPQLLFPAPCPLLSAPRYLLLGRIYG
ncbi:hypothetical protein BCR41DRAFT_374267 [Lobosporangium transversale]|uniref:Uncharacterized protein n=1 Tax=Lobosporangium transversale TaxID=64571 RepID=A0A1Y2GF49_9FUNG|nr:hypothetical protein BCR41DRAFT_374267 [Lobosporangium transversale]ORZ05930.1 hypothetical protein BCR41DRAFT_374267 [Lobosporangium transversale]|eukprot:XP_021877311.1 hypothetical protein BCR41DRAFT_374267 [Lobosporangium transversale]